MMRDLSTASAGRTLVASRTAQNAAVDWELGDFEDVKSRPASRWYYLEHAYCHCNADEWKHSRTEAFVVSAVLAKSAADGN